MTINKINNIINYNKFTQSLKHNNTRLNSQTRGYIPISDYIGPLTEDTFVRTTKK